MSESSSMDTLGEFGLIDHMADLLGTPRDPDLLRGIGDDAAVYRIAPGRVHVVTTDALIEGVHFMQTFMPMTYLGIKAIAVNVSDVVAMNARPRYATVALGMPPQTPTEAIEGLYQGMRQACEAYSLTLVGGDVTTAGRLTLSVTVIGEAAEDDVVYRSGARPGDALCVTGDLGAAYAGLKVLLRESQALQDADPGHTPDLDTYQHVIHRQLTPTAKLKTITGWAARGVRPHAMIDISDGLASEVHHLCRQSGCGAVVRATALPVHLETHAVADQFGEDVGTYTLYGGEDYELLFALPPADLERLDPDSYSVIGLFTEPGQGVQLRTPAGTQIPLPPAGYQHFGG